MAMTMAAAARVRVPLPRPLVLLLNDAEGLVRSSAGARAIAEVASLAAYDGGVAEATAAERQAARVLLAVRERSRVDVALLDQLPSLELILQTGGHAYHIDLDACRRRGITVALGRADSRAPLYAVRELTLGLMLATMRHIPQADRSLHAADASWPAATGRCLHGRRLGILGCGRQGSEVARLGRAFGMDVVAWQRRPEPYASGDDAVPRLPLDELLATSDIVSVHLRLSESSRRLLDQPRLARMKPGAVLINTARGAVVDEAALVHALQHGPLAAAGLDVFEEEPLPATSPLRTLPNVVLTPHAGWTVQEVFSEFADIAARQLQAWLAGALDPRHLA